MNYLDEKYLQAFISKHIGVEGIKRISEADAWGEFDKFASQILESHKRLVTKISDGQYPVSAIQEELIQADAEIQEFRRNVTVGNGIGVVLTLGSFDMKDPFYAIHQFRMIQLALLAFYKDRAIRENNLRTKIKKELRTKIL